ncbi:hypothetical protein [Sedimentitalea todarodis]|uniref:Adenylate cyclase n=1 Tax=Sedimentitalea todarodis TaxID=1631240 RepID=A0ABU3VCN6_9RHOB|nr:hypothetical protein [Sedimentitalea todarodis]MDU9003930.1 hypothetical protein [Sedimentitalea todarodis]
MTELDSTNRDKSEGDVSHGIEHTLTTVLASGALGHSERRANLLRYLVDLETSGQGDKIKAYAIALDVFGRDEDFDPNSDSIVRVEIGRLRDGLRIFYGEHDDPDLWTIDIPKGTYRPTLKPPNIGPAVEAAPQAVRPFRWAVFVLPILIALPLLYYTLRPAPTSDETVTYPVLRIAVMPFEAAGDQPNLEKVAFGLYTELTLDLSAYPWIAVVSPLDPEEIGADYALKSQLLWQGDNLQTNSQLISLPGERLVWSKSYSIPTTAEHIQETHLKITSGIASSLGSENGISPDLIVARNARKAEANLEGFLCFISTYQYVVEPTRAEHLRLRDCLEDAVEAFPEFGEAWAALGVLYMDEVRFGRNPRPGRDSWKDARVAIDRSLELAPLRNAPLMAGVVLSVQAPDQDLVRAQQLGRKLREMFPRHPATLALIGSLLSEFFGLWSEGLDLAQQAIDLENAPPSGFFVTPAFFAAMQADDAAALAATEPLTTQTSETELLLKYLAAARNGKLEMMAEHRALLAQKDLRSDADLIGFVRNRRFHDELQASLIRQLEAAFLIGNG